MTIRKRTVIILGTPSSVTAFLKPRVSPQDGGIVKMKLEGVGTVRIKMAFENDL